MERLRVFQIYYSESTMKNCWVRPYWWIPYDNTGKLTPFFENSVIANIFEDGAHKEAEYVGIFSHDIGREITFKEKGKIFSPESLRDAITDHDVYSFQKRRQQGNIVLQADNYHPGFTKMTENILNKIGYEIPRKTERIILFNHMVMRSEVYERYYKEMLKPAMEVMATMDELNKNAGYKKDHPDFTKQLGYNHYPFHPFICERLPSVWMEYNKDLKFKHIF